MNQRRKHAIFLALICCLSFATFSYVLRRHRANVEAAKRLADTELTISPAVSDAPLPACDLVNKKGSKLADEKLRTGKVMLVLVTSTCTFCFEDAGFLQSRIESRKDIRFYGVISFGTQHDLLSAERRFPFELYFDRGGRLRDGLGINGVPIKLYLEDGVVKKVWMGSTVTLQQEQAFDEWLRELS